MKESWNLCINIQFLKDLKKKIKVKSNLCLQQSRYLSQPFWTQSTKFLLAWNFCIFCKTKLIILLFLLQATRAGGCLVIVGAGSTEVKIPLVLTMTKEIDIRGVFRYANDYPIALSMVASGKVSKLLLLDVLTMVGSTLYVLGWPGIFGQRPPQVEAATTAKYYFLMFLSYRSEGWKSAWQDDVCSWQLWIIDPNFNQTIPLNSQLSSQDKKTKVHFSF